jgi:RNA polymerase sigma-70 factor, ECF subfamily
MPARPGRTEPEISIKSSTWRAFAGSETSPAQDLRLIYETTPRQQYRDTNHKGKQPHRLICGAATEAIMQSTYALPVLPRTRSLTLTERTSDEHLINAIAMGDRQALGTLFARHNIRVYRFIVRFTGNASLAEDMVSEVFLAVWLGAASFKKNSRVSTWLLAIARNKTIAALRRISEQQLDDETAAGLVAADDPETSAAQTHRRAIIRKCLMELPTAHREILDLIYYHEKTLCEVAEIVGIPYTTVKTRVFYARRRMSELLESAGVRGAI